MGQSQSIQKVKNPKQRAQLQQIFDTSVALMVVNLVAVFLPLTFLFWILMAGPWIQFGLASMGLIFSCFIFRMASKNLQEANVHLNRTHLAFAVLMFVGALVGAAIETETVRRRFECDAEYNRQATIYYNGYYVRQQEYYAKHYEHCMAVNNESYCKANSYSTFYYDSASYPAYSCGDFYSPAAVGFGGVATPIFALIQMILLSIVASQLWNHAINESISISQTSCPVGIQASSATSGAIPSQLAPLFLQWATMSGLIPAQGTMNGCTNGTNLASPPTYTVPLPGAVATRDEKDMV